MPTARRSAWQIRLIQCVALFATFAIVPGIIAAQSASFAGTVLTDSIERPISDAQITLPDIKRTVRSDSAGNFLIGGLKAGHYLVQIRHVGYVAIDTWFDFKDSQKVEADLLMRPLTTQLSTVLVRDAATRLKSVREQEFEEHRHSTGGRVFPPELLEKEQNRAVAHIVLARTPGIRSVKVGGSGETIGSSRGGWSSCSSQIILNGMVMYRPGFPLYDLNQINSMDVIGMIYYTFPETPERYLGQNSGAGCGTLVIWTKG